MVVIYQKAHLVKHVLVTGGAGFIGSHLAEALLARGDRVTVVDDESTGTFENLAEVREHPRLECIRGNLAEPRLVARTVAVADEVYHLAAAVGVALIARQPMETIQRNIHPTELLLDELVHSWKRGRPVKFFLASTSEVYGKNPKPRWTEEEDLVFGATTKARWSYGASKAIDEFLALACGREYQLPVVIGRFFNVVGPRQTGAYGMVLPRFVDAALADKPLIVHDDGRQTRCFAHVADVVATVLELMDTSVALGRVFNVGSDQPVSILELAERVIAIAKSNSRVEFQSYAKAYDEDFEDVRCRVPDLTRLHQTVQHRNRFDLNGIIGSVLEKRHASAPDRI